METAVDYQNLEAGSLLDVETKTRHYRIECVAGNKVRISGHPELCPEPVLAWLQGSLSQDGTLDSGFIEPGRRMLLYMGDGRPITTSSVMHVHLERPVENLAGR